MQISKFLASTALTLSGVSVLFSANVSAQQASEDETIEEVVVTGSYIRGRSQENSASPISVVNANDLNAIGATQIADLVQTLTINNGSQNNPDAFTQGATTGTANFNLRGLGVASTLVLLNGRRQVVTASNTNDGLQFVDTNSLVPQIAIQRVEILKDGAAAIYGSDAVAGVVNLYTDDKFEGFTTTGRYGFVTDEGSQDDLLLQAKFGWGNDRLHVLLAGSYFDRTPLTTEERRLSLPENDTSSLGNPGAFIVPALIPQIRATETALGLPAGTFPSFFIDPTGCAEFGGTPAGAPVPVAGFTPGVCQFDFGDFFNLVPEEERIQVYGAINYDINDTTKFHLEAAYADNEAIRGNSPTFPFLQTGSAVIPTTNPNNVFGTTAIFFGRAIGNGGDVSPQITRNETFRISGSLQGDFGADGNWNYDLGVTYARNDHFRSTEDTITDNFQAALFGNTPSGEFFNPFATSFTTAPNSDAVLDFIIGESINNAVSELTVIDAVVSGTVGEVPAGEIGLAVGFQYRDESLDSEFDEISNNDGFGFLIGNPDFSDSRSPYAFFAEVAVPLTDTLEFSGALRFEDYGGTIGDTLDPKFQLLWRPTDTLTLRGTYSTSFRAPSVFQQFGVNTSLNQISDPLTGSTVFAAVRTDVPAGGNGRPLNPEQSEALNFGASWRPVDGLSIDIDYFNYSFTDAIITTSFQEIVNNDPLGSAVIRAGGDGTAANPGQIVIVNNDFVNASSIDTDGLDLSIKYDIDTDYGVFQPFFDGTWVLGYDFVTGAGTEVDGLGSRNFALLGVGSRPTPEFRFNTGISFVNDTHEARVFVRFIDGIDDNQNPGSTIDSQTTVDVQYALNLGQVFESFGDTRLTVGAINLFDQDPPFVATNGGFESRLHDPRGRVVYFELGLNF
ncbi:TonB-dependent siderophore receptor [Kordiimonas sp. SCSIO 12610]|uniref:TonB-dependent receptor plug domain-containing protein n=1 Tax=Kordiimonas sp. SCSIO 12610 TaxID=2829597 RepID=UPI00210A8B97|nr:TonB-dependent receptor [Kordiimonas sp. SCSIO 12610]UTW55604.1 TonB-dependent receptor [Kordiimonas sp. SCSIO 12610]